MRSQMFTAFTTTPLPRAVNCALVQQAIIIFLSALILDGGVIAQICMYALAGYWGGAILLVFRRGAALSHSDLALIRWGYIPVCVISFLLTYWIWWMRGYADWRGM